MHATHPAASVACPPTFPRFPIGHPLQLVRDGEPFTSDHVPRGQFPQSSKTVAPNATKYLPAGQSLQPSALLPYLQEEGGWRYREGGGKGRLARGYKGILGNEVEMWKTMPKIPTKSSFYTAILISLLRLTFPWRKAPHTCTRRRCLSA